VDTARLYPAILFQDFPVIIPWPLPGLLMNLSVTFSAHISATLLDLSVSLASNCASALHHTRPVRVIGRTS
jgi:hypothetical protein